MTSKNNIFKNLYLAFIYALLYIPIIVLIIYSFNNAKYSTQWHGATLDWYRQLIQDGTLLEVTKHSLSIAFIASTVSAFFGTLASLTLHYFKFSGKKLLHGLIFSLIIIPDIVMGIALLLLFTMAKIQLGFWSLLLAHISFCIPFAIVTISSRLSDINPQLFMAAKDLGASDLQLFTKVFVPILMPGIIAAWLLSFTLSMDDVVISYFVSGVNYQILPLQIYSMIRQGVSPEINALCTVLFAFTLLLVICSQVLLRKRS